MDPFYFFNASLGFLNDPFFSPLSSFGLPRNDNTNTRFRPNGRYESQPIGFITDSTNRNAGSLRPNGRHELQPIGLQTIPTNRNEGSFYNGGFLNGSGNFDRTVAKRGGTAAKGGVASRKSKRDPEIVPITPLGNAASYELRYAKTKTRLNRPSRPDETAEDDLKDESSQSDKGSMDTTKTNGATPKLPVVEKGKPRTGGPKVGPNRRANPDLTALVEKDIVQTDTGVGWDDIAGLDNVKQIFKETLLLPKLMPQLFKGILRPWRGILLFGPPGTGKTLLAKAVASQHGSTFFNVLPSSLTSKHYGESEKLVRALFETARARAPAVIFIDEVDAFCSGSREHEATRRVRCELLSHMDGVGTGSGDKGVLVLAATNHPWDLDEALKRRFEKRIYIPLPDEHTRSQIIGLCLGEIRKDPNLDVATLTKQLIGYSGSDIRDLCQEMILIAAREVIQTAGFAGMDLACPDRRNIAFKGVDTKFPDGRNIGSEGDDSKCQVAPLGLDRIVLNRSHFERAKEKCRKSVDGALIRKYKRWNELYGSR